MKKFLIRTGLVSGIALVSMAILLTGTVQWKKHIREKNILNSLVFAGEYISNAEPQNTLRLVDEYRGTRNEFPGYEEKWVELELTAAIQIPDNQRLEMIYHDYPVIFSRHPDGALVLARYFIMRGKYSQYDSLRKQFFELSSTGANTWQILDADKELQMGNSAYALEILQNIPERGSGEAARLVRMALILSGSQPEQSLKYLRKAVELEPENPEPCLALANFLERNGLSAEARNFYVTADIRSGNNPFFSDQLAEYYIRTGKYNHAIDTWRTIPDESRGPLQLLKLMGWSKLTIPRALFDTEEFTVPMLRYSDEWSLAFSILEGNTDVNLDGLSKSNALYNHPLILWCEMLQSLKTGKYPTAHARLLDKYGAFSGVHPELSLAILMVLEIRSENFSPAVMNYVRLLKEKSRIEKNVVVRNLIQDYEFIQNQQIAAGSAAKVKSELWKNENIFPLIFSSVGWSGAADQWYNDPAVRLEIPQMPSWAVYVHIKSLLRNRSYGSNYNLIELFPSSISDTALGLLRAEVYLANEDYIPALKGLAEISQIPDDFGVRAAWLTGLLYLERGRLEDVDKLISSSSHFRESTRGREIAAKLKLARSDVSSALEIYRTIQDHSAEAQVFLYNHYQQTGDGVRAQKLLQEIQSSNINEPALWNLVSK